MTSSLAALAPATQEEWENLQALCLAGQWACAETLLRERAWFAPSQKKWLPPMAWRHLRSPLNDALRQAWVEELGHDQLWRLDPQPQTPRRAPPQSFWDAFELPQWRKKVELSTQKLKDVSIGWSPEILSAELRAAGGLAEPSKGTHALRLARDAAQYWNARAARALAAHGASVHFGASQRRKTLERWVGDASASFIVAERREQWPQARRVEEARANLRAFQALGWIDPVDFVRGVGLAVKGQQDEHGRPCGLQGHAAAVCAALLAECAAEASEDANWREVRSELRFIARHPQADPSWAAAESVAQAIEERKALGLAVKAARETRDEAKASGEVEKNSEQSRPNGKKLASRL